MSKKTKFREGLKTAINPARKIKNKKLRKVVGLATNPAATIAEGVKKAKKSKLKSLFGKALNIAKAVAPAAASAIPGVGGIASQVLSTMNDDSWFEGDSGNGAAFNELLKAANVGSINGSQSYNQVVSSALEIVTAINASPRIKEEFMPTLLAFIRKRTNNVLVDGVDNYYTALMATMYLYAIYYTLRKIEKLALNVPVNIPTVTNIIPAASPQYVNQMIGIADSLEAYLRGTAGLPYPLCAYMRWRFGTTFHSDNTGKPGVIMYNPPLFEAKPALDFSNVSSQWMNDGQFISKVSGSANITAIATTIEYLKEMITSAGRAAADMHIAFMGNGIEYDVEDAHFDSKEYNLRANLKKTDYYYRASDSHLVVKDSRLDMNAAIQAILLSTPDAGSSYFDNNTTNSTLNLFPIWDWTLATYIPDYDAFLKDIPAQRNYVLGAKSAFSWYLHSEGDFNAYEAGTSSANDTTKYMFISKGLSSLQCHNWADVFSISNGTAKSFIFGQPLSYDTARVSQSSIEAIHRSSIKNLFRGDFTYADQERAIKARTTKAVTNLDTDIPTDPVVKVEEIMD